MVGFMLTLFFFDLRCGSESHIALAATHQHGWTKSEDLDKTIDLLQGYAGPLSNHL